MKRPLAYITAAWSGSTIEDAETAARYCRQVYDAGYSPICPILLTSRFLHRVLYNIFFFFRFCFRTFFRNDAHLIG